MEQGELLSLTTPADSREPEVEQQRAEYLAREEEEQSRLTA